MTTTLDSTSSLPAVRDRAIWKPGIVAGLAASVVTTLVVVASRGSGIPVAVSGEKIPLAGFGQFTLIGALVGIGLAKLISQRARLPRRTFLQVTTALTVLSTVPDVVIDATTATKVVLAFTHVVAAAVIIPVIARRLNV
jgi:hypothetical protein